jgi:probable phosphoglycerate mutase
MKIHLVRHAETIWHSEDRYVGHSEIDLTENGYLQSEKLMSWARVQNIEAIYTSKLNRSILTAEPTAAALNIKPMHDNNFNEMNFGEIEGLTKSEFATRFPKLWQEFQIRPATTEFPSGETGEIALRRSLISIEKILAGGGNSEILIIFHGTLLRLLLTYFFVRDLNEYRKLFPIIDNVGITTIFLEKVDKSYDFKLLRFNSKIT